MNRHSSGGFFLIALFALSSVGCVSLSRSYRSGAPSARASSKMSNERLLAIAQTFERQKRYSRARQMYSTVLRRKPDHVLARQRVDYIAALMRGDTPEQATTVIASNNYRKPAPPASQPDVKMTTTESATPQGIAVASVSLQDDAPVQPYPVAQAEGRSTDDGPAVTAAAESATDDFAMPKDSLADRLNLYIEEPANHVTQLVALLNRSDPDIRSLSAFLIGQAGSVGKTALPRVRQRLAKERVAVVRVALAEAIVRHEPLDSQAFDILQGALRDADDSTMSQALLAATALSGTERETEVVELVVDALNHDDGQIRAMAALALGDFSSPGTVVVNSLRDLATDDSEDVRVAADLSLSRLGHSAAEIQTTSYESVQN